MMRPNITGPLADRIRRVVEEDGFKNPVDFIRYCVRKELERREELEAKRGAD